MQDFTDSLTPQNKIIPVVGMKATIFIGSDRSPAEVTRVITPFRSDQTFPLLCRSPAEVTRVVTSGQCWIKEVKWRLISGSDRDGNSIYEFNAATSDTEEIKIVWSIAGWRRASGGGTVWLNRQECYFDSHFWDKKKEWNKQSQI